MEKLLSSFWIKEQGRQKEVVSRQEKIVEGPIPYEKMWQKLADEITLANDWAKLKGIDFVYVLQPDLYSTKKSLSPYEWHVLNQREERYANIKTYFSNSFTQLRNDIAILSAKEGFEFLDCDYFVQQNPDTVTLFVDDVHFGSVGNLVLKECVRKVVSKQ